MADDVGLAVEGKVLQVAFALGALGDFSQDGVDRVSVSAEVTDFVRDRRTSKIGKGLKPAICAISPDKSAAILEALRQLRDRLLAWRAAMPPLDARHAPTGKDESSRAHAIRTFIQRRHAEAVSVSDLARTLGLSESRAMHLVKELFGCGFAQLLTEARLKTAATLLRNTDRPVHDVCLSSGFGDLSHFHRTFARHFKVTPRQYRRASSV